MSTAPSIYSASKLSGEDNQMCVDKPGEVDQSSVIDQDQAGTMAIIVTTPRPATLPLRSTCPLSTRCLFYCTAIFIAVY